MNTGVRPANGGFAHESFDRGTLGVATRSELQNALAIAQHELVAQVIRDLGHDHHHRPLMLRSLSEVHGQRRSLVFQQQALVVRDQFLQYVARRI